MTYRGTVRKGVVELEPGSDLPDGTPVRVEPETPVTSTQEQECECPAFFLAGRDAVDTGIPDLATNLDHYLYGHPKVCDGR